MKESSYESQRLENIRNNQEVLASLGLVSSVSQGRKRKRVGLRRPRKPLSASEKPAPTRRSARLRPGTKPHLSSSGEALGKSEGVDEDMEEEKAVSYRYDDSDVLRYVADGAGDEAVNRGDWSGRLVVIGSDVEDCDLKRMYSMDWKNGVLLAGGHQGRVAMFGARSEDRKLLMSFKASRGWISAVQFLELPKRDLLFLTASNDGAVMLWDAAAEHDGSPKEVSVSADVHTGGIFSLHASGVDFVTGSKDRSVVAWKLRSNGELQSVRVLNDHHTGVVKSVQICSGSDHVVASVGNDAVLRLTDLRDGHSESSGTKTSSELHNGCCVNSVRWHPMKDNILMTAGFDTRIELHDSRKLANPMRVLDSHMPENLVKVKSIYHPCFVRSGSNIITTGEKTEELTVYCTETGNVISRGHVSFQATALAVDDPLSHCPRVAAAHGKQISFYSLV